ncbi:MAG: helix-turn-helix transcriptional regulator [Chloroflexota bacterium]|nr:helix-turn-helix transcriptional regulator [Chloroflexota bacterium]
MRRLNLQTRSQEPPSLGGAILAVMGSREMSATNVADRMESGRNRATLYRILSGATQDPKVSTFIDICRALEVSPIDVLQLANLVPHTPRDTDLLDVRMRQIFSRVQAMPEDLKRLAIAQIGAIADTLHEHSNESGSPVDHAAGGSRNLTVQDS